TFIGESINGNIRESEAPLALRLGQIRRRTPKQVTCYLLPGTCTSHRPGARPPARGTGGGGFCFRVEQSAQWEAASRMSACGARGGARDRSDVGEHAAGVPCSEGSYQRWAAA